MAAPAESKKKGIYLCKNMAELNAQVVTPSCEPQALKNTQARLLLSTGQRIIGEASKSYSSGDEEQSYILYMRAATMYTALKTAKGYTDAKYFDSMSKSNLVEALNKAEVLSKSLQGRYALLKDAAARDDQQKESEMVDARKHEENKGKKSSPSSRINGVIKSGSKKEGAVTAAAEEPESAYHVTVAQLKNLIEQKSTSLLVIDCRGRHDYDRSHVIHGNCICIPQEVLDPGFVVSNPKYFYRMSAHKIQSVLKEKQPESYHAWNKRGTFDKVILYDWSSSYGSQMTPTLTTLFMAMTKWDHETDYKSPPVILQGGIRNLYYSYPFLLTKPQNTISDLNLFEETEGSGGGSGTVNGTSSVSHKLNSISYPSWDDEARDEGGNSSTTTTRPSTTPSAGPNSAGINNNYSGTNNTIPQPPSSGGTSTATIDRSTKPKSATAATTPFTNGTKTSQNYIVPVHNRGRATPAPTEPKVNGVSHGASASSSPETTAAALNAVLDSVITSSKELKVKEEELEGILHSSGDVDLEDKETNANLRSDLARKKVEIEALQAQVTKLDGSLATVKAQYDSLAAAKAKQASLPSIRPSSTESNLDSKFKQKADLEEHVRQIRAKRKEEEEKRTLDVKNKLPTIPDSGPAPKVSTSRPRVPNGPSPSPSTSESATNNPKMTQSATSVLRPMSQDASPSYQRLRDEPSSESPRSLLKRSHSHPNIAQSLSEEDSFQPDGGVGPSPLPQYNRSLKPSASSSGGSTDIPLIIPSRARQFHAVNSTEKHRTGLKNLGNTCYMNSIVQCLIHIPGLVDYFNGEKWKNDLRLFRPQKQKQISNGEVSLEFHAVVQEMNYGHRSIAIQDFKNNVGRHHPAFKGYDQQDSHEFLTLLLDWLHEELNTVCKMKHTEQKNDGLSDAAAADQAWKDHCISNSSRILQLFGGQQKSALRCLSCGKESVTFEYISHLSVPIPSINNRKVDIYQCIDLYTTEETVPWTCPHCKSNVKATKKIDLWRLPPYLIIHLQRFYNDGSTIWYKKRLTEVEFPVDNLDLTSRVKGKPFSLSPYEHANNRIPRSNFMLQAVSNHYGSMDGGHYTAYCRKHSAWAKFDDQEVTSINSRDVITPAAYILFYCNNSP